MEMALSSPFFDERWRGSFLRYWLMDWYWRFATMPHWVFGLPLAFL
jgi:hypothetical protein